MLSLLERMAAAQKTVDRFKGKPLVWGRFDCIQIVVSHARHAGRKIKVPKYGDNISATRGLKEMGFSTLAEAMDAHFERIDPARVMMGDFVEMPGSDGFTALTVALGNGRVLGFHEDIDHADILQPLMISGAWNLG